MKNYVRICGGLGNQMFRYAANRAYSLENNSETVLYINLNKKVDHEIFGLKHCSLPDDIKYCDNDNLPTSFLYKLLTAIYNHKFFRIFTFQIKINRLIIRMLNPILINSGIFYYPVGYMKIKKCKKEKILLEGAFQSIRYFEKYDDIICNELQIKDIISNKNQKLYNKICSSNSVCIHIRRGDYVNTVYDVCNKEYYEKAISLISKKVLNPNFMVFSNDIDWVKGNINFGDNSVTYIDGNNQFEDMKLMYSCKHFIIANSSYSWWAQHLCDNKNKIVVAPSKWMKNEQHKDIYEEGWTLIDVK